MPSKTKHPDIYAMIDDCAKLWSQTLPLDEQAVMLHRVGKLTEAAKLYKRYERIVDKACKLERRIAFTKPRSTDEYAAQMEFIPGCDFDPDTMIELAWRLGYEAARLGLDSTMPPALRDAA